MNFERYIHLERFGAENVEGIEFGKCYIFPKIDGTNSSVWLDENGCMAFGSRNRQLSIENDNQGFMFANILNTKLSDFFKEFPKLRLYGEWLVPHTLKTYRDDAWNRFYIFDVSSLGDKENEYFLSYEEYQPLVERFGLDYIRPQTVIQQPSFDQLVYEMEKNTYLIKDGCGVGEGIVIKNYGYYNQVGNQVWAKIVRNEFKEQNRDSFGVNVISGEKLVEQEIVGFYLTESLIEKTYAKLVNSLGKWENRHIPVLLDTAFSELVREELWEALKKTKFPTINFKTLKSLSYEKVKKVKSELFTQGEKK